MSDATVNSTYYTFDTSIYRLSHLKVYNNYLL